VVCTQVKFLGVPAFAVGIGTTLTVLFEVAVTPQASVTIQ
jgi:hypothetical protein